LRSKSLVLGEVEQVGVKLVLARGKKDVGRAWVLLVAQSGRFGMRWPVTAGMASIPRLRVVRRRCVTCRRHAGAGPVGPHPGVVAPESEDCSPERKNSVYAGAAHLDSRSKNRAERRFTRASAPDGGRARASRGSAANGIAGRHNDC